MCCLPCPLALLPQKPKPFSAVGLRYCDINMTKPGLYVLGYTASYNDGPVAYAERYLVVEANCASGEVRRAEG